MPKNSIADYSATAASNTDIQSVDIDEGCAPSGINNAIRELMADLADMNAGTTVLTSPSASVLTLADGSSSAPALANTGDTNTGIFFPAADTVGVAVGGTEVWRYGSNPTTAKNLLQNGSFAVAQRGTSFAGLGAAAAYTLDRWKLDINGSPEARVTITQDTDVPSGQGFATSLKIDVTTAESAVAAGETFHILQNIEAQNLQLLAYNTASAKTMALSFWLKSPKSGTHCVSIDNQDGGSTYIREFTVASADTWEKHSVTFPGDTAAGINNDNGTGLTLIFPLINGTSYQGTANTWTGSGTQWSTSNQQNLLDNTANNIYIAGVQLEVGSVATDFEHEDYGTTLKKCYRYFQAIYIDNNVGYAAEASASTSAYTAMIPYLSYNWRATPSASIRTNSNMRYRSYLSGFISATTSSTAGNGALPYAPGFYISCSGTLSGLTDGMPGLLNASSTMLVDFSAEL